MSRGRRAKEIDSVIDRGTARLDKLPETELAERVQKLAATTGRWRVKRVNDTWVLLDEDGRLDFEDRSLGSVAFLSGLAGLDSLHRPRGAAIPTLGW